MNMNEKIEVQVINELKKRHLTLSTAESCTGGLIGAALTSISGSSEVFMGGIISYDNSVKHHILGVKIETLKKYGAVSEETAFEMAEGAKICCKTDIGISVTGIAGPSGGTKEKPIGTVCFGISYKKSTKTIKYNFPEKASRKEIRDLAVNQALTLVLDTIANEA